MTSYDSSSSGGNATAGQGATVPGGHPPMPPTPPPLQSYAAAPGQPPPPAPRKRSFLRSFLFSLLLLVVIGAAVLAMLLGIGVVLAFMLDDDSSFGSAMSASSFSGRSRQIRTAVIRPGTGKHIAVIAIKGVISNSGSRHEQAASRIVDALRAAVNDDVCAIILDMDTPGGEITASDEVWRQVKKCREEGVPVVTCMRSMAASGGYYIAAGSDWIVANRLTFTGSIGVIMPGFNALELLEKIGVEPEIYRSGDMKDMLSWSRTRTEKERTYVKAMLDEAFKEFAAVVADGREAFEDADAVLAAEFADGRVMSGAEALRYQLVDQLGYFDDAVVKAEGLGHTVDAKLVAYSTRVAFIDALLSSKSAIPANLARALRPWNSAAVDAGRIYFLAPEALAW